MAPSQRTAFDPLPPRWTSLASLAAALLAAALLAVGGTASAQGLPGEPVARLVALHYQDVLTSEDGTIDLFVPPPPFEEWDELSYSAEGCLVIEDVLTGPPDSVVIVRMRMPQPGSCVTRVELEFGDGERSWSAAALVAVTHVPDVPANYDVFTKFVRGQARLPWNSSLADTHAEMIEVTVQNTSDTPLHILGLGNDAAFSEVMGTAFRYDPETYRGRYADLQLDAAPFEPTTLAPGETAYFGLVLDPGRRLPTGAGAMTFRPVILVELDGERYTLPGPRLASAWGAGLP